MVEPALKYITAEKYLELERAAIEKHEFYQGEMFVMPGATVKHNRIQRNFIRRTGNFLEVHTCEVFGSDLRVHIPSNSLFTYPDALIVCGKPELLDDELDTLLNPVVIVEILSKSTQSYDRGDKFMLYRAISSLKEYILISSEVVQVEHFCKREDGTWLLKEWKDRSDVLHLQSIDFLLPLSQLYDGVTF
ncbi:MAG: Uma2 family endonuclease [Flavisolibacter sp.]|nr:Uma2 family endonuclease [Flavisolibacter sp.]